MSKLVRILIILVLALTTASVALAHSGGTDSQGGHTDHSTGEYHYHHGYSAHDHYDMDGDGDLDCPYEFRDKTDHKVGSSGGSSTSYVVDADPTPTPTPSSTPEPEPQSPKMIKRPHLTSIVVAAENIAFFASAVFLHLVGDRKGKDVLHFLPFPLAFVMAIAAATIVLRIDPVFDMNSFAGVSILVGPALSFMGSWFVADRFDR